LTNTNTSPNNAIQPQKSKKKEPESLTLEEKIQRLFLYVDTDRYEELSKLLKKTRGLSVATDASGRTVFLVTVFPKNIGIAQSCIEWL
jgi:hypothetical protein